MLAAMFVFASVGWASVSSCDATTVTLGSFSGNLNPGTSAQGCYETDNTFSQFNVTSASTGSGTTQSNQTDEIAGSNTFSAVTSPWTETATFSGATGDWTVSGSGNTIVGSVNMLVNSNEAYSTIPTYQAPSAGDAIYFNTLGLAVSGSTGVGGSGMTVIETYCAGSLACTVSDEITITATYNNNSSSPSFSCSVGATSQATCAVNHQTATFGGGALVQTVNVTDQYTENKNVTLMDFANSFGDFESATSPEPSTFVLLGSALAALGLVRLRRKRA